ncbi:hypothetical protein NDU88_000902 [Pleurodeles waltl]|uniref:Uncharacterized protein n=1 Tax=Pleurodeles waltl TaxID=8319 RepID=A0AAV7SAU3_PLEWA|nr:hypothetical protein NDU88_000902 [Pleurodeles waltl]
MGMARLKWLKVRMRTILHVHKRINRRRTIVDSALEMSESAHAYNATHAHKVPADCHGRDPDTYGTGEQVKSKKMTKLLLRMRKVLRMRISSTCAATAAWLLNRPSPADPRISRCKG